ncbi:Multiple C2 and transmembrane domain-containing protein 2 [Galemys pyrenaicus]|uniref:Multiple C2 and transmembrane domain-containing protein 2 n=1 Tax=Galemys pyrenaicus TaxID=202257 RepID=A0A8J6DPU5_GALPY|nr:Multiple C2 and transmembrane domain-containing protein 2 [Galemys pyrenaicus]
MKLPAEPPVAEGPLVLHAAMDLDKPSVWGSLKQRTRPLLINLGKKKGKKNPNKPLDLRARHHLDRRLSLSVPDLLEAEALVPEGRPYSGPQSAYTSVPSSLSSAGILPKSSSSSLKQSEEDLDWSQEEASHIHALETDSEETFVSPAGDRRASGSGFFDLLQKTPLGEDALEESERPCGAVDLNAAVPSQPLEEPAALQEAGDGVSTLPSHFAYLLTIHLKEGRNLVIRDRCGKAAAHSGEPACPLPLTGLVGHACPSRPPPPPPPPKPRSTLSGAEFESPCSSAGMLGPTAREDGMRSCPLLVLLRIPPPSPILFSVKAHAVSFDLCLNIRLGWRSSQWFYQKGGCEGPGWQSVLAAWISDVRGPWHRAWRWLSLPSASFPDLGFSASVEMHQATPCSARSMLPCPPPLISSGVSGTNILGVSQQKLTPPAQASRHLITSRGTEVLLEPPTPQSQFVQ